MTERERFINLFKGKPVDRLPVYFFGSWIQTKERWAKEGFEGTFERGDIGPQIDGMDKDWETGIWNCHGLVNTSPTCYEGMKIIEETDEYIIRSFESGLTVKAGKGDVWFDHVLSYPLKPTRESWEHFKTYLNSDDKSRYAESWEKKALAMSKRKHVSAAVGGSLYGSLRDWMGVEELSCLMYEDPELLKEMVSYTTDYYMALMGPVAKLARFDFIYIFEDCCGSTGPLFSPALYTEIFDSHYKRLISFYKEECAIPLILVDSDGLSDELVPLWAKSGFDIIFPIEVGKWGGSPGKLREKFGNGFGMMGGVDKHLIASGGSELREHLESLIPAVKAGKYLPIPDHRIPPSVSYEKFKEYLKMYNEVFENELL